MRKIIITVTAIKNGEEATIDVTHSNDGNYSEVEDYTVQMLNGFLFRKVDEASKGRKYVEPKHKVKGGEAVN